jgi:RNA polymerase sigma-70 factor (ECF subfamily)
MADLHRRCGNVDAATRYRDLALASAPSPAVKALMERRLGPGRHDPGL